MSKTSRKFGRIQDVETVVITKQDVPDDVHTRRMFYSPMLEMFLAVKGQEVTTAVSLGFMTRPTAEFIEEMIGAMRPVSLWLWWKQLRREAK